MHNICLGIKLSRFKFATKIRKKTRSQAILGGKISQKRSNGTIYIWSKGVNVQKNTHPIKPTKPNNPKS